MDSAVPQTSPERWRVLFVCAGNICRSPLLEGMLRRRAEERGLGERVFADSCAVTSWFLGAPPEDGARQAALRRGVPLEHRAKLFEERFFACFDTILAVDRAVLETLLSYARTPEARAKVHLATDYSVAYTGQDIPDPYGQDADAFNHVAIMAEDICAGLLRELR
jgi:protein-tyrosine phosphatase